MAKYADNSNNSEDPADENNDNDAENSKLNESCRAECDS